MISPRDVLGINARQLLYIKRYNGKKAVAIADSKLKTKKFLQARGIRVPKLVATFRKVQDIHLASLRKLPADIVIKPNNSSGGEGIVVLTERRPYGWLTVSGKRFTFADMAHHLQAIVQGAFSATGYGDIALIEKRIITHSKLQGITYKGLPDVRIIVFNLVPVLAMLRLPTAASEGKANLHSGGVGAGIDIAKGDLTYLVQYDRLVHDVPGIGNISGFTVPFWDEILRMAVQAQYITNIGYLGVDIALDRHGPILLEVNARPGLMVQVANLVPLRKRLRRVEGLKVKSVARGIAIAKALFGRKMEKDIKMLSGRTIMGNKEYITLHLPGGPRQFQAKINPRLVENYMDQELAESLLAQHPSLKTEQGDLKVRYQILDKKSQSIFKPLVMESSAFDIIIGKRELKNVLIDPYKYDTKELPVLHEEPVRKAGGARSTLKKKEVLRLWRETDKKLSRMEKLMTKHFSLLALNYKEEMETFVEKKGLYNPKFVYKNDPELLHTLQSDLEKVAISEEDLRGVLFARKRDELLLRLDFYAAMGQDAQRFTELSEQLFAKATQECSVKAHELFALYKKHRDSFPHREQISAEEIIPAIYDHLRLYQLDTQWSVMQRAHGSRISVGKSKKRVIYLRSDARFSPEDNKRLFAHEIDTHVLRLENGLAQPYRIFSNGTAGYLETEEGLAVYTQNINLDPKNPQLYTPAMTYLKTMEVLPLTFQDAMESSFVQTFFRPGSKPLDPLRADARLRARFRKIYRVKRGIGDTSMPGGCTRDLVYFTGLQKVEYFLKHGGDIHHLYKGKISVDAVPLVAQMDELKDPLHIPRAYS